jgi:hypothetical protein
MIKKNRPASGIVAKTISGVMLLSFAYTDVPHRGETCGLTATA